MGLSDNLQPTGSSRDRSPCKASDDLKIRDLVKKRGIIKGRLTKFANYVNSLNVDTLDDQQQCIDLKLRIQGATNLFSEFNNIQTDLEESVLDKDLDEQLTQRELFEDSYYSVLSKAECMYKINDTASDDSHKCSSFKSVKLPTISLQSFEGSHENWIQFRDSYLSLVHNCKEISNIQKFHYLKSSLKGSAALVIDSVEFSSNNYGIAWELLLTRYNNSRLLIHNHVKSLFTMHVLNKESPGLIRNLIDTVLKNLRALKILGEPTDYWDTLIIYIVVSKLDQTTEREWEEYKSKLFSEISSSQPALKIDDLLKFLRGRADMLEALLVSHNKQYNAKHNMQINTKVHCNVSNTKPQSRDNRAKNTCLACKQNHPLYSCQRFLDFNLETKRSFVKNNKLCVNCLRSGHSLDNCRFGPCRLCNKKHNSLIHSDGPVNHTDATQSPHANESSQASGVRQSRPPSASPPLVSDTCVISEPRVGSIQVNKAHIDNINLAHSCVQPVLLSTALVQIADSSNNYHLARALLDSGSQRCFITESLCDLLNIPLLQSTQEIRGVGNSVTQTTQVCEVEIKSRINTNYSTLLQCFVLPSITSTLPAVPKQSVRVIIPDEVQLADPQFYEAHGIDILIGADKFWELLKTGKVRLQNGPYLHDTYLGWIISGPINVNMRNNSYIHCNFTESIETQLRQFWELEELPISGIDTRTDEERACEDHFVNTTTRDGVGRFSVRIPFKSSPATLGESFSRAERRFLALEKRLERDPGYKKLYSDFMNEYIALGHMTRIQDYSNPHYFLPHHGVYREHSATTKLRVVFDASAPSSTDISLNDLQMVGPPIQGDLVSILLRFRQHRYTACADVEKMYRQCLIHEDQRHLQLILWRDDPSKPIDIYQLNRVTYGTASAAFLSCRCLKQLASDCGDLEVARIINEDFYVDDMITGNDDQNLLLINCAKASAVLQSGCFPLRKWLYNFDSDNTDVTVSDASRSSKALTLGNNVNAKTLGLNWYNLSDEFYFNSQFKLTSQKISKRYILSTMSQIFDPLGLLGPVIIIAKIMLQKLWLLKQGWDDEVPSDVKIAWYQFANALPILNTVRIPRHVIGTDPMYVELHIFTDASETAYGTCCYVRTINTDSTVSCKLLISKSKVAPLKPISVPKLELSAALLGARLYEKVRKSLRCTFRNVVFWCDSTIVLGWLRMAPNILKTFVQNRVAEIHELTKDLPWCHVSGKDNPADLVSRGLRLEDLSSSTHWWEGPTFLREFSFDSSSLSPNQSFETPAETLAEVRPKALHSLVAEIKFSQSLFPFHRFSQLNRMRRAAAYVLRFINNVRSKGNRQCGALSVDELKCADVMLVRFSQMESYADEYKMIKKNNGLNGKHNLTNLNLFIDNDKILRIGGRLNNSSEFTFDKKHPMLISSTHWFSVLLFRHEHKQLKHAGPQALLYHVRDLYWPVGGRNLARQVVNKCVTCRRFRGKTLNPIMGNLPKERITPSFPFQVCGVDYAGPVMVLNRKGRGSKLTKGYISLFICFLTRCLHLELVSDLSTDAYLLALKRFMSRRGKPSEIFSDNGRNFVGLMNDFTKFLTNCSAEIIEYATSQTIKFKFIPPYASHFGGLWEAGVKSCKHHLLRSLGNAHLTFEEMSTALTQIEAILNSRPLSPMSADPQDYLPLSPAHFLIGRPLTSPACTDLTEVPTLRLNQYQRVEQIRQHFWIRWAKEYVSEMQTRRKWKENKADLKPNTLVVIKEDNSIPLKWSLGRVITTVPGKDGVSRVADIRTASGVVRRAFSKICPLFDFDEVPLEDGASKAGGMLKLPA